MTEKPESIRVFVRVRPPISSELAKEAVVVEGGNRVLLKYDRYDLSCEYDKVFDKTAKQDSVFGHVAPVLMDVLVGVNCSILAYGQTSAGKVCNLACPLL